MSYVSMHSLTGSAPCQAPSQAFLARAASSKKLGGSGLHMSFFSGSIHVSLNIRVYVARVVNSQHGHLAFLILLMYKVYGTVRRGGKEALSSLFYMIFRDGEFTSLCISSSNH